MKWKIVAVIIGIIAPFITWACNVFDGKDVCIYLCLLVAVIGIATMLNYMDKRAKHKWKK